MSIPVKEMKAAIKDLNASGLIEGKIKTVGIKREEMLKLFGDGVLDVIEAGKDAELPDTVINFYNDYVAGDDAEESGDEAEAEEKKPAKKTSSKKSSGTKKSGAKKSGGAGYTFPKEGTQAHKIDSLLKKGVSVEHIVEKTGLKKSRVLMRINAIKDRGGKLAQKGDKYKLTV